MSASSSLEREFSSLNDQQKKAIGQVDGRVLILAGAGTGKTRVLTLRMAHLMTHLGVPPYSILGLTFTNKAAAEMRHRVGLFVNSASAKQVTLSTFHSFCMQILRAEIHRLGYTTQFSIYSEQDVERLVKLIARDILEHEGELPSLSATLVAITQARNKGLTPDELPKDSDKWHDQFVRTVYQRLQDSMRAYNAVDFDHLLWLAVELFEKYPDVLDRYQERYRYIMIDEYQDTNPIQYRLASLLAAKYNNLCVVGDDDQAIYGWRGANVNNILQFDRAFVIKLEQNYRSTQTILEGANSVIQHNRSRHGKKLWSNHKRGELIHLFHAPSEENEAEAVVCRLVKLKETLNLKWKDFAILYRSNALSRQFELALIKGMWKDGGNWVRGVPYEVFGGLEFYERREIKDLFAYLRAVVNPLDQEALLRIINQPRRGIGEGILDILTGYNRKHEIPLWEVLKGIHAFHKDFHDIIQQAQPKALEGIRQFIDTLEGAKKRFKEEPLADAMTWLIERIDYRKAVKDDVKSQKMRDFKWENVEEFVSSLADYDQQCAKNGQQSTLHDFITSFPLGENGEFDRKRDKEGNKVQLMTFHSAKGLEFPVCFLVGMEDHIIPHEKSVAQTGIEEERRLMYVAMTRAMKLLTISMAHKRKRMGKEHASKPSRFLYDIPKEFLNIYPWDQLPQINEF